MLLAALYSPGGSSAAPIIISDLTILIGVCRRSPSAGLKARSAGPSCGMEAPGWEA